ncbi:MAG: hypothetical protein JSU05_15515, partial [Bacteroidetes bacterium]|nr:hypothetical protein [Bacteroidota bacterium]
MKKKIINRLIGPQRVQKAVQRKMIKGGNLLVKENSDISNCKIYNSSGLEKDYCNIQIGEDCLLEGTIVLYTNKARVTIGDRSFIGKDTFIYCYEDIEIGADVMLSWGITVMDTNAHSLVWEERKDDVINWKKGQAFKNWENVKHQRI